MTINKDGPQGVAPELWEELYESVNELMAHLGAFGEVDTQGPMYDRVMNALFDIDGGDYRPKKPNALHNRRAKAERSATFARPS